MAVQNFISLVRSLSPALFRLPLLGHVAPYDLDGQPLDAYVRPTTISAGAAGPAWRKDAKGWWFGQNQSLAAGGGIIIVPDSGAAPELRATSGTLFFAAKNFQAIVADAGTRIISKRDAGGIAFELLASNINTLTLSGGGFTPTMVSTSLSGARSVAVRYVAGVIPSLFVDGVFRALGSGVCGPIADDADLSLANLFSSAYGSRRNDYGAFAIFNDAILGRAITDPEIAQLHEAWESIISVFSPKRTYFLPVKATDIVASTPLAHLSGGITPGNLWLDSTGYGRDGTITGRVTQTRSPERTCLSAYGAGDPLIQSAISFGYDAANWTLEFNFLARSTGGGGQGALFALTDGGVIRALLCFGGANTFSYTITHDTTPGVWTFAAGPYNVWHTLVIRHARSGLGSPTVELDGESIAVANPTPPVGALTALAAPRVNLLNVAAVSSDFDGCIDDFKFYDSLLSDAQSRALYVDKALSGARRLANRTDYPVSPAAVAAGGMVGPWRAFSGTWKWDDDGQKRRLINVTAGNTQAPSSQVYGAVYFKMKKVAAASSLFFSFMASSGGLITGGTQNAYSISISGTNAVQFYAYTAGVAVFVFGTAAGYAPENVEYEFLVTRTGRSSLVSVWIRGGAFLTWTLVGSGTPVTIHTVCNFMTTHSFDPNDTLSDVTLFPQGYTLLPTELVS